MKKMMPIMLAFTSAVFLLAGCGNSAGGAPVAEPEDAQILDEEESFEELAESLFDMEDAPDIETEEAPVEKAAAQNTSIAVGAWYTDGYDETDNWALSYKIELSPDGSASCTGWRNRDTGTFEMTGDNKALITFDHCETDSPDGGYETVAGFSYTIEMTIKGDDAQIKIDAPDVISNLEDGTVHRSAAAQAEEGDAGEGVDIADGEYITDETYKGDISSDGATISIETALSHYDENWNTVPDYKKQTYVFSTSKDCKCVIYTENTEVYPVAEQVEFINEFLHGNSGLPITLIIKNNELTEIGFSS